MEQCFPNFLLRSTLFLTHHRFVLLVFELYLNVIIRVCALLCLAFLTKVYLYLEDPRLLC